LLLLRHAMADPLVDRRLGNAAADVGILWPKVQQFMTKIDGWKMPPVLLEFMVHAVSYHPVLKPWEKGDYAVNPSLRNFPDRDSLLQYVSR
jgi:hypothetical protein